VGVVLGNAIILEKGESVCAVSDSGDSFAGIDWTFKAGLSQKRAGLLD
jgi:hypothetical protein